MRTDDTLALNTWRHDAIGLLRTLEGELAQRDARIAELEEQIEDWQCASGLIGSCGDPSPVRPEHLERRIHEDEQSIAALKAFLGWWEAPDLSSPRIREPLRDAISRAVAALPDDVMKRLRGGDG